MSKKLNNEMLAAYKKMLSVLIDYKEYEWSGDPWEEDARAMGEMEADDLARSGELDRFKEILEKFERET